MEDEDKKEIREQLEDEIRRTIPSSAHLFYLDEMKYLLNKIVDLTYEINELKAKKCNCRRHSYRAPTIVS
jgi:hypothetical protein